MTHFSDLGLAEPILRSIEKEGYTKPTPIQTKVIPAMLEGHDLVGIAQTGTGKTAAFVLPILNSIINDGIKPRAKHCRALILSPTRELATQIADNIRTYGKFVRHSSIVVVGGVKPQPQIKAIARGVDIIIATPGRLLDHVKSGALKLDETTTVVLDEGDQMFDMGFIPDIRRIMGMLPSKRQTLLMSATMPKQVRLLAADFLNNPKDISVGQVSRPIERIDQQFIHLDKSAKREKLVELLAPLEVERAIVFTRTKRGADKVQSHLEKCGLPANAIHGNKSQGQRQRALRDFKLGGVKILVATDIAARGIDVDGVSHVINYELPNLPESYVHRIGRTGRAGRAGIAISLYDNSERAFLRDIERLISQQLTGANNSGKRQATNRDDSQQDGTQQSGERKDFVRPANGKKRRRSEQRKKNQRAVVKAAKKGRNSSSANGPRIAAPNEGVEAGAERNFTKGPRTAVGENSRKKFGKTTGNKNGRHANSQRSSGGNKGGNANNNGNGAGSAQGTVHSRARAAERNMRKAS